VAGRLKLENKVSLNHESIYRYMYLTGQETREATKHLMNYWWVSPQCQW